jgi:hypothetical protein
LYALLYIVDFVIKTIICQALVAHACNPSYSEGRDLKGHDSKPASANSSMRSCLEKKTFTKKGLVEWLKL